MPTLKMKGREYTGNGQCVYCMETFAATDLTDEHIIPEAIHGALIFKRSACVPCARKSNKNYENVAINADLLLPRLLLDLKGKKGKGAQQDIRHLPPVYAGDATGSGEWNRILDFPIEDYPKFFTLQVFPEAGLIVGIDRGGALVGPRIQHFSVGGRGLLNVTVSEKRVNGSFAMMLAKIGYCYAAAERGVGAFEGDPIRALLSGDRNDVYNFVGSVSARAVLTNRHLHSLYLRRRGEWLTVLVHLFASLSKEVSGAIPYEVVVGRALR